MLSFGVEIPFVSHLGFTLHRMEGGESELRYEARPEHLNSFSVTHGGASMTLLDVTMATAARSITPDMGVVTIEMKTSFLQPARGPLVARGRLLHRTATMAFTEGSVYDAEGRLCCHATGTFKYVKRLPVDGRSTHDLRRISTD
ncbi:PaaI family thioesterase [Acidovorax lacteus]|uniref:PaaI family thioesterase n=1 Tax=Acidovorax lacteus TaxID=1924988 RepID=A0ABP8L402_9BURK